MISGSSAHNLRYSAAPTAAISRAVAVRGSVNDCNQCNAEPWLGGDHGPVGTVPSWATKPNVPPWATKPSSTISGIPTNGQPSKVLSISL